MRVKGAVVLAFLMVFGANVRAAEGDASRGLQNLVYYPHAGQFLVSAEFYGALADVENIDNGGVQAFTQKTTFSNAIAALGCGLTDGLRLTVSEQVVFHQNAELQDSNTGAVSNSGLHGFGDPTITLSKRLHDSDDDGFYADGSLGVFPYLGRALAPGYGQSGNDLNSGWQAEASLPLFYRFHDGGGRAQELELELQLVRYFGGVLSGSQAQYSTLIQPNWESAVVLADRLHLDSSWYLEPKVILNMPFDFRNADQTSGAAERTYQADFYAAPALHIGYLPKENLLLDAYVEYLSPDISGSNGYSYRTSETTGGLTLAASF